MQTKKTKKTKKTNKTNITENMKRDFEALTSGQFNNFVLYSVFVDGEPTAAICAIISEGNWTKICPLWVGVTDGMKITDHNGDAPTFKP